MMENIAQMSGLQANENMLNLSRQDITHHMGLAIIREC